MSVIFKKVLLIFKLSMYQYVVPSLFCFVSVLLNWIIHLFSFMLAYWSFLRTETLDVIISLFWNIYEIITGFSIIHCITEKAW